LEKGVCRESCRGRSRKRALGPLCRTWAILVTIMNSCWLLLLTVMAVAPHAQTPGPSPLLGTWRGTSTCSDRVAAPACNDEVVVYEFTNGAKPGTVHWAADKVVNGKREPMGEMELAYDEREKCWKAEFNSPRVKSVWRLSVDGNTMTGSARLLPGNETIRTIAARKSGT
jgi:hypothetical protein